jgi:NADH dehydrogenase
VDEKRIVVVGGGFGGFYALKTLSELGVSEKHEVTLIDKSRSFAYLPSLPYLLSNKKTIRDLTEPYERISKRLCFKFIQGELAGVSLKESAAVLSNGDRVPFDYLIIAVGATTEYYNIPGAEETLPSWRLEDYLKIEEELKKCGDKCKVCIAGGGLTGVEVAGELAEVLGGENIVVVEKMPHLMPTLNRPKASEMIEKFLVQKGVRIVKNNGVVEASRSHLKLEDSTVLDCDLIIWSLGVRAPSISFDAPVKTANRGWIAVKPSLQLHDYPNVYAVGDVNHFALDSDYAMKMAEEAILQGKTAAKNVAMQLEGKEPIHIHKPIFLASKPKSLVSVGFSTALLVWENRLLLGKMPYIGKMLIESIVMRDVKGQLGGGTAAKLESALLRTISR